MCIGIGSACSMDPPQGCRQATGSGGSRHARLTLDSYRHDLQLWLRHDREAPPITGELNGSLDLRWQ